MAPLNLPIHFRRLLFAAICLPCLIATATAAPQTGSTQVSFDEVLAHALSSSPLVRQIDVQTSTRLAEALALRTLPNAELSVGALVPRSGSDAKMQFGASVGQPFRLSHFGLRDTVSRLMGEASNVEQKAALTALTQEVRLSYVTLWALRLRTAGLRQAQQRAARIAAIVKSGRATGLFGAGDDYLYQARVEQAAADLLAIEGEAAKAEAELLRLTTYSLENRPLQHPKELISTDFETLIREANSGELPVQRRYALLESLSQSRAALARSDMVPPLTPQLTYSRNEDGVVFFGAGISIELPFTSLNQSERLQRDSELRAARSQREYVTGPAFTGHLERLAKSVRSAISRAVLYSDRVVPLLSRALEVHEQQLRAGQGTPTAAWLVQSELFDAQTIVITSWMEVFKNYTALAVLAGDNI